MGLLVGAVTLVGVIGVLELIVLVGVVRKLKEHSSFLAEKRPAFQPTLRPGQQVGDFATDTVQGAQVSSDGLLSGTEVGFFSPTCKPCWEKIPGFSERAAVAAEAGQPSLAVVVSMTAGADSQPNGAGDTMVERLRESAAVVLEEINGPVSTAFRVLGFPATLVVDRDAGGQLIVGEDGPRPLPAAVRR